MVTPTYPIAVIGMSGLFPQAEHLPQFYQNLRDGLDCVREIPRDRKHFSGLADANYQVNGCLDRIDQFDHRFFELSLSEAIHMDPNHRLALQLACAAIEDGGYALKDLAGSRTGVMLSAPGSLMYSVLFNDFSPTALTGTSLSAVAGRVAYLLDLHGPALMLDTACSSSLATIETACSKLLAGQCEMALAGGINLQVTFAEKATNEENLGVMSASGRSRPFDADAAGTGSGEGGGILLLKPLAAALADGDRIHAVIRAVGMNQDGNRSNGLSAPSVTAQEEVLVDTWRKAEIDPETLGYIEAHGTGTKLGDPIEFEAISKALRRFTEKRAFCAVGSVKSNLGHLDYAAGIAGVLKVIGSLKSGTIFPSLHFNSPNPLIDFQNSGAYVADRLIDWQPGETPRRAGVSSFGISGTNVHVVLEEAPTPATPGTSPPRGPQLITLSAKSQEGLNRYQDKLSQHLAAQSHESLSALATTLNRGRDDFQFRQAWVAGSHEHLAELLHSEAQPSLPAGATWLPVFLLSGDCPLPQGLDQLDTRRFPAFAEAWQSCASFIDSAHTDSKHTRFAFQYAMLAQLQAWGLRSQHIFGQGCGNLVAGVTAGKLSLAQAFERLAQTDLHKPLNPQKLAGAAKALSAKGTPLFIELASDGVLSRSLDQVTSDQVVCRVPDADLATLLLNAVALLYRAGFTPDWHRFHGPARHVCDAPTYPFENIRCWPKPPGVSLLEDIEGPVGKTAWVFSGGGTQYTGMGRLLYESEAVFRATIDACAAWLATTHDLDLHAMIFDEDDHKLLDQPLWTHLAVVAVQMALADFLIDKGLAPHAVVGHSMGELPAAYASGALSLEAVMNLAYHRGRLMAEQADVGGGMLVVGISAAVAKLLLKPLAADIQIAAYNSPQSTVLTGDEQALSILAKELESASIFVQKLNVRIASHSHWMASVAEGLRRDPAPLQPQTTETPMISTVTTEWVDGEQVGCREYWADNVSHPVRFEQTLQRLLDEGYSHFVELGPHPVLKPVLEQIIHGQRAQGKVFSTLHRSQPNFEWLTTLLDGGASGAHAQGADGHEGYGQLLEADAGDTATRLAGMFGRLLHVPTLSIEENVFQLGFNSLMGIRLLKECRDWVGKSLTMRMIYQHPTIAQLAALIDRLLTKTNSSIGDEHPALVTLTHQPAEHPLFVVHPGGGDVMSYAPLAQQLDGMVSLKALRARGLDGEALPHEDLTDMAAYYVTAIQETYPEGPVFLGGWSLGGVVAWEMARQLTEAGRPPARLMLFDAGNLQLMDPHLQEEVAENEVAQFIKMFGDTEQFFAARDGLPLSQILAEAAAAGRLPEHMDPHILEALVRVTLYHDRGLADYQPGPFAGRLQLFQAEEKPANAAEFPDYGWGHLASGGVHSVTIPGTHATIMEPPNVALLAQQVLALMTPAESPAQRDQPSPGADVPLPQFV